MRSTLARSTVGLAYRPTGLASRLPLVSLGLGHRGDSTQSRCSAGIHYGGGQQLYDELVQKELKLEVQSFFLAPMPTQPLGWFKKGEIQKPEDLKGIKYRTVGLSADLFKQLGSSVVILPGAEIVPALDRGVIDGAEWNNTSSDMTLGLQDVCKTYMVQSYHQACEYLEILFNKKKLAALPADLKAIVRYSIMAESADMGWKFQDWNSRDLEELKNKHKVKVVKTPKACWRPSSRRGMPCWRRSRRRIRSSPRFWSPRRPGPSGSPYGGKRSWSIRPQPTNTS